jgi:hypothetical protein
MPSLAQRFGLDSLVARIEPELILPYFGLAQCFAK